MKKTLFMLLFVVTNLFCLQAQNEEATVRKAIVDETITFHTNPDRSAFLKYWNITDQTVMTYSGSGGQNFITGAQMRTAVKDGTIPGVDNKTTTYETMLIRVSGNTAWASFIQVDLDKAGVKSPRLQEFRMLEKINGEWKITCSSIHELK